MANRKDAEVLAYLIGECHIISRQHGWWEGLDHVNNGPEKIALMHSELSEALEAMRVGNWTNKDGVVEELADTVIRIFDYAGAAELDLGRAIIEKMEKNRARPHKHGGKLF